MPRARAVLSLALALPVTFAVGASSLAAIRQAETLPLEGPLEVGPLEVGRLEAKTVALEKQIEAFLEASYPADEPGAAVIATRDGKVVFRGAFGMADLELGVPLEPDMVFRLGSITKQFTAAAILLLEEQGKLSVDDPITKFLPDYPVHGHTITVAHLLAHTSGIRSYTGIPGWMQSKIKQDLSLDALIEGFENEPMDFAPGERFLYNNSGYVLLGAIIEKASGKSYQEYIDQEIFRPLGMTASYYGDHDRIIPRRTPGYDGVPGSYRNAQYLSMSQPHAAGSLLSTVDDLAKWDAALYTRDLLSQASLEKQVKPFALTSGESTGYAYGLTIGELRGHPVVQHGGGIFGFSTFALRLPEDRVFVAVLSNTTGRPARPSYVAQKVAALVIGDPFPDRIAVELPPAKLERYVGTYRVLPEPGGSDSRGGQTESAGEDRRSIALIDGRLYLQRPGGSPRIALEAESEDLLFDPFSLLYLTFERDTGGGVTHLLIHGEGESKADRAERTLEAR